MNYGDMSDTGSGDLSSPTFFLYDNDTATTTNGYYGGEDSESWFENWSSLALAASPTAAVPNMAASCVFEQPPLTNVRFWIVTVFGTTVSVISIVENSFFFFLFSTRKHHRTTYNMYMMFLTFFDFFVSGAYVLLMSTNVLSDYLQSPMLVRIWFHYMVPILTVSHCGITSSCFIIIAATFERYCITLNTRWVRCVQRNRKFIILGAILLGIISKGTICIEFKISYVEECAGTMTEFQLQFAEFVYGTPYHTVWRFWYRNIVTVFFPFFALLALNIRIVRALSYAERQSLCGANTNSKQFKRKKVARSATRATVLVVFTYLISNIINVVLTTWEHIDSTLLVTDLVQVYAIALDLASLLTNLASAMRPPIYLVCQPTLRQEVFALIKQTCRCGTTKSVAYNTQTVTDIIYTKVDDNSDNPMNTERVNLAVAMPHCATVVAAAVNKANQPDLSVMDLMKDEEEFLQDERGKSVDSGADADLIDLSSGRLESMAARMRRRRQLAFANRRLASMVLPSCVNAAPCLTHTVRVINGSLRQPSSNKDGCLEDHRIDERCHSVELSLHPSIKCRKPSALSDHNYSNRESGLFSTLQPPSSSLTASSSFTSSLPATPTPFNQTDVKTTRILSPLILSVEVINATAVGALDGRLSHSLASFKFDSPGVTVDLSEIPNNNNQEKFENNNASTLLTNNEESLNKRWLPQYIDKETLL